MNTDDVIMLLAASPGTAYREYLYRPRGQLARWIGDRFDVVARPGQPPDRPPQRGDVLIEVALGRAGGGRCVTLDEPELGALGSRPRLLPGQLILRPLPRAEMSEPMCVEPTGQAEDVGPDRPAGQEAEQPAPPGTAVPPGRLVVDHLPLLRQHAGTPPDLLLKWNAMTVPAHLDVVVHLHGFSDRGRTMRLTRDKEPISGLDFADPANPASTGRSAPALLVLPRGHYFGGPYGNGYSFPALEPPGALADLVREALARFGGVTGVQPDVGRLIVTAHSGGGASLMKILRHTDPDEVHTFDALYSDPSALIDWASRRAQRGEGALRVLYRPAEDTARNSQKVHHALCPVLTPGIRPRFRVDQTSVLHLQIPRQYGWRLLADPAAELPQTTPVPCPSEARAAPAAEYFADTGWRFTAPSCEDAEGARRPNRAIPVRQRPRPGARNAEIEAFPSRGDSLPRDRAGRPARGGLGP